MRNQGTCRYEWCTRPARSKGLCSTCYGREWARKKAASDPDALDRKRAANRKWAANRPGQQVTVTEKTCGRCKVTKSAGQFYRQQQGGDGLQAICAECSRADQAHYTLVRRCKRVGITVEEFHDLWQRQGGLCKVCKRRPAHDLDHCHATERFRGLLCRACNRILGTVQDDAELLRALADYLEP